MPDELAPTLGNFDAIVAARTAQAEAADTEPDVDTETDPEAPPARPARAERDTDADPDEPENDEDDEADPEGDDEGDDPEESDEGDPEAQGIDPEVRAPLKAMRSALKSGRMTPELLESIKDLTWEVETPNGVARIQLGEMPRHIMREARFHRELAKTREHQEQAQRIVDFEKARTQTWRQNAAELYQGLLAMGCESTLDQVFWHLAEQKHEYAQSSPAERARIDRMRQQERALALERSQRLAYERQLAAAKQAQQQQPGQLDEASQAAESYIYGNMDKALGAAFKSYGVSAKVEDGARTKFAKVLGAITAEGGYSVEEAVQEAAAIVADELRELKERARATIAAERRGKPRELPPRAAARGPAKPPQANGERPPRRPKGKPATASEFGRRFLGE